MTVEVISAAYDVLDERFLEVRGDERLNSLYDGFRWAERPCYVPAGRYLLFNDIPEDRMLRWDETTGACSVSHRVTPVATSSTARGGS
jgi:gluconolactonase